MELLKDVASALTILKLGSLEEQQFYVSTWSEILSVCAQELEHGAFIWKQSIQKNMESQMLSEPQGTGLAVPHHYDDARNIIVLSFPYQSLLSCHLFFFSAFLFLLKKQGSVISLPLEKFTE